MVQTLIVILPYFTDPKYRPNMKNNKSDKSWWPLASYERQVLLILFPFESKNNIKIKINHQELQEMDAFEK